MTMTKIIAISGKGGTGKTALTAMFIKYLSSVDGRDVLAVDADPDTNLPAALGMKAGKTIGDMKEYMEEKKAEITGDKMLHFEAKVLESLVEGDKYDLLVMGRSEGPGCYCYVNNLLRSTMSNIVENYDTVVIDTGAGLEHFSRQIIKDVDAVLVVTDQSKNGLMTAKRIKEITDELKLGVKEIYIVANKVSKENVEIMKRYASDIQIEMIGEIPFDENIARIDLSGGKILDVPDSSPAYIEAKKIAKKVGI